MILDHALALFNEKGIEYVGVREIANDLNLRVGNVTYYFPTKDDIVAAITTQLADLNSKTIRPIEGLTMTGFLTMYQKALGNHYLYRCLFISFVQQMERNKKLASDYFKTQQARFATLNKNIHELIENGYLKPATTDEQVKYLIASISLTARFWISESRITHRHLSKKQLFRHYLLVLTHLLSPYATKKGLKQIEDFCKIL